MKKNKLLLVGLLVLPILSACTQTVFKPTHSYPGDPFAGNMTVNFYYDYSHSDEPFYSMRWYMLKPLGECPKDAVLTASDAKDPLYGKFLGYSEYPTMIDEEGAEGGAKLWDFAEDYKQSNILNLYGIWVSEQEVNKDETY